METVRYTDHREIPQKYRKIILEQVFVKRVAKVPIATCNEIINEYLEEQQELESLKDFKVVGIKDGKVYRGQFKDLKSAEVFVDRICEYGENLSPKIAFYQAERLIKWFAQGQWFFADPTIYDGLGASEDGLYENFVL
jgi:hypothetical protein